ncbi:MAG TPA: hypothetical protein EYP33_06250, partial [Pyrodictium sp.]|nr:hypothetical protein [Pyrodictium sp.]
GYPNPTITPITSEAISYTALYAFSYIPGPSHALSSAQIKFQISNDGSNWYFWNGNQWSQASSSSETNTAVEINQRLGDFVSQIGGGKFYFKAFLIPGSLAQLENVNLGYQGAVGAPFPQNPPATPTALYGQPLSSSSIRWHFQDNSTDEAGFRIKVGDEIVSTTEPEFTQNISYLDEEGLSPNTPASGRYVVAFNTYGESNPSEIYETVYSLAQTPNPPALQVIDQTTLRLVLDLSGNPSYTEFLIHEATTNKYLDQGGNLVDTPVWQDYLSWGGSSGIEIKNLEEGKEYIFEVKARNGDQIETDYSESVSAIPKVVEYSLLLQKTAKNQGYRLALASNYLFASLFLSSLNSFSTIFLFISLFLFLLIISFHIKRINERNPRCIPKILFLSPQKSFEKISRRDHLGTYLSSYLLHKKYSRISKVFFLSFLSLFLLKILLSLLLVYFPSPLKAEILEIQPGDKIAYEIKILNQGREGEVSFSDQIPKGMIFNSGSLLLDGLSQPDPQDEFISFNFPLKENEEKTISYLLTLSFP